MNFDFDPKEIRNIIFDFGGVLFDIDYHLPVKAFQNLGFHDFHEVYAQAAQTDIFDKLETGKVSEEEFYNYLHSFVPDASRLEVEDAWNCILLDLWTERVDFVKQVRERGIRTFMLSNTNAIHVAQFEDLIDKTMGLPNFYSAFEKIYYSNVIGIKKPYPSTYLRVCEWNGLVPSETIFIDDSIQHVKGAAEAGLRAIHLKPGERVDEVLAVFAV
jgi:putative hydrolase of the HAD superfamily